MRLQEGAITGVIIGASAEITPGSAYTAPATGAA